MTEQQIIDLLHETQRQRFGAELQIAQALSGKTVEGDVDNLQHRVDYLQSVEAALEDYLVNLEALDSEQGAASDFADKIRELENENSKLEDRIKELEGK